MMLFFFFFNKRLLAFITLSLFLLIASCTQPKSSSETFAYLDRTPSEPSDVAGEISQDQFTQTPHPLPTNTLVPTAVSETNISLDVEGPWVAYYKSSVGGIVLKKLLGPGEEMIPAPAPYENSSLVPSPSGIYVAYISAEEDGPLITLFLVMLDISEGEIILQEKIFEYDFSKWFEDPENADIYPWDFLQAIGSDHSLAWAPDGGQLAYIGAIDDLNADLYVIDIVEYAYKRLSSGKNIAYWPTWSPDGENILYLEVETFGTGAGALLVAAWKSTPSNGTNTLLLNLGDVGYGRFGFLNAWLTQEEVAAFKYDVDRGPMVIGLNIKTSYEDPLFLVPCESSDLIGWSEKLSEFIVGSPGDIQIYDKNGSALGSFNFSGRGVASPDGEFITIFGDGCYLGRTGFKIIDVSNGRVIHSEQALHVVNITWFLDSSGLIIEELDQLRYFALDGAESVSVDESDSNVVIVLK